MIVLAFLMVSSRIRYTHVLNKLFRENKTFDYFTYLIFGFVLVALVPQLALVFIFAAYVATGPAHLNARHFRPEESSAEVPKEESIVR